MNEIVPHVVAHAARVEQIEREEAALVFEIGLAADFWIGTAGLEKFAAFVDYYEWNEKLIDAQGDAQALGELFGWFVIASQYYERYQRPMMHTETNRLDARDGPRCLWRQWHNVQLMRQSGVPIVGFTWYSLTDQIDWDIALRAPIGNVVGLFDLNRDRCLVGLAYKHLCQLFEADLRQAPSIEAVLNEAQRLKAAQERKRYT